MIGWKEGAEIEQISTQAFNYQYFGDDGFYFQEINYHKVHDEKLFNSDIKMVECRFSMYEVKTLLENKDTSFQVHNYSIDKTENKMLLLTSSMTNRQEKENQLGVFDLETENIVLKFKLRDKEVIGRMKTNLYHLIGGHIYFNNRVIKVRYDLMLDPTIDLSEEVFFDHYEKVLHLKNSSDVI